MMTQEQRNELAISLVNLYSYYDKEPKKVVIAMMIEDLQDLDFDRVKNELLKWRRNPKNRSVPLPAQIRDMIRPESFDDDSIAREITARIIKAVDKFGYPSPNDAKKFIGEVGWSVVGVYGGWEGLCQALGDTISMDTFNAQARELIKSRAKYGVSIGDYAAGINYEDKTEKKSQLENVKSLLTIKSI